MCTIITAVCVSVCREKALAVTGNQGAQVAMDW